MWSVSCPTQLTNSCTLVDEPSPGLLSPDPGSCRPGAGTACQPEHFENVCACVPQSLGDKAKDAYKDAKDAVQVSCRHNGQRFGCIGGLQLSCMPSSNPHCTISAPRSLVVSLYALVAASGTLGSLTSERAGVLTGLRPVTGRRGRR